MFRRASWFQIILYAVIAVCIAIGLAASVKELLIPIIVLGTIFLLYKYPPKRHGYKSGRNARAQQKKRKSKDESRRSAHLRVIRGRKPDSGDDEDDRPRYH